MILFTKSRLCVPVCQPAVGLFDNDIHLVIVAESSGKLLICHVTPALLKTPESGQLRGVNDPKDKSDLILPPDERGVLRRPQELIYKLPEKLGVS